MAGVKIEINNAEILKALGELKQRGDELGPVFQAIGDYLDVAHRDRWDAGASPDGTPWEPLQERTKRYKKKHVDDILVRETNLRDTLRTVISGNTFEFGTNEKYGATHHYGDAARGIPARPWLGLSDDDEDEVLGILADHFSL